MNKALAIEGGVLTVYETASAALCDNFDLALVRNERFRGPFAKMDMFTSDPECSMTIEFCGDIAKLLFEAQGCLK